MACRTALPLARLLSAFTFPAGRDDEINHRGDAENDDAGTGHRHSYSALHPRGPASNIQRTDTIARVTTNIGTRICSHLSLSVPSLHEGLDQPIDQLLCGSVVGIERDPARHDRPLAR